MKQILCTAMLMLSVAAAGFGQVSGTTIYYPHIVNGSLGGHTYKTTIFLTNPAASGTINATVMFSREVTPVQNAGAPLSLTVTDQTGATSTGSSVNLSDIGPGQTRKLVTNGVGVFASGFATVVATGNITGAALFADFDATGRLTTEAGVPASAAAPKQAVFVDTVGGYTVGVAYVNPDSASANVSLRLLNASGVEVATTTHALGGGNHRAAFPNELFSAVPASTFSEFTGSMQISSTRPLSSLALRLDPTLSIFTTVPPVQIASLLAPAVKWLTHRPWPNTLAPLARLLTSLGIGRA